MSEYGWALYALIGTLGGVAMFLTSEYFKEGGIGFLTVIRVLSALSMLPFIWHAPWPSDPVFYYASAGAIILIPVIDIMFFRLSVSHGAGLLSRIIPVSTGLVFIAWLIIDGSLLLDYLQNPTRGAGITLSLIAIIFFAFQLRKCKLSLDAFRAIFPAIIAHSVVAICIKYAFDHAPDASAAFIFLFLLSVCIIPLYFIIMAFDRKVRAEFSLSKNTIKAGVIAAIGSIIMIVATNMSVDIVENPSYTSAISLTSSFWILLIYKAFGRRENAKIWPGMGIVVSAIALVLLSGQ